MAAEICGYTPNIFYDFLSFLMFSLISMAMIIREFACITIR